MGMSVGDVDLPTYGLTFHGFDARAVTLTREHSLNADLLTVHLPFDVSRHCRPEAI